MKTKLIIVSLFIGLYLVKLDNIMDQTLASRLGIGALLLLLGFIFIKPKDKVIKFNVFTLALATYFVFSAISITWAMVPVPGYVGVATIGILIASYVYFAFYFNDSNTELRYEYVLSVLFYTSLLVVLIGCYSVFSVISEQGYNSESIYLMSAFSGHKNLLSSYLFLLLGTNLILYFRNKKIFILLVIFVQLFMIMILRSRAVFLAGIAMTIVLLMYLFIQKNIWTRYKKKVFITAISLMSIVFLINQSSIGKELLSSFNPQNYIKSASGAERLFVWYKTSEVISDNWLLGTGLGNWKLIFPSKSISGAYRLESNTMVFTRVHNDFLEIWAEIGIIGILSYLAMFLLSGILIIKLIKSNHKFHKIEPFILLGILFGYCIIAFFDFPKERVEHQLFLGFFFASLFHFYRSKELFRFNVRGLKHSMASLAILIGIVSFFQIKGEYYTRKSIIDRSMKNWEGMINNLNKAESPLYTLDPVSVSTKWYKGLAYFYQGKLVEAKEEFEKALHITPNFQYLLSDYGSCLVLLDEIDPAISVYKRALFINPKYEDARFNLSYTLALKGQFNEAIKVLDDVTQNPSRRSEFLQKINELRNSKE